MGFLLSSQPFTGKAANLVIPDALWFSKIIKRCAAVQSLFFHKFQDEGTNVPFATAVKARLGNDQKMQTRERSEFRAISEPARV